MSDEVNTTPAAPAALPAQQVLMMPPIITPMLKDKAFWAKILAPTISIAVSWINHKTSLGLDATAVDIFVGGTFAAACTFIVSHKWAMTRKMQAVISGGTK